MEGTRTHIGRKISSAIRRIGQGKLPVFVLPTYADSHGAPKCVGHASTWTEAVEAIHDADYRIMYRGGEIDVVCYNGDEQDLPSILVTVYPKS